MRTRSSPLVLTALLALVPAASAQLNHLPEELEGVGVTQQLDALLPLELTFRDEDGKVVRVGDYFDGRLPALVTLNYSNCPQLCSVQLQTLTDGLRTVALTPGEDFRILTVSIDPEERPEIAKRTKGLYIERLMRPEAAAGWHFLTGTKDHIDAFCAAVGFTYNWVPEREEYAHPPAVIVVTPEGRIARYLPSLADYTPANLKYSLVEASAGAIGDLTDQIFLSCFYYDPQSRSYVLFAWSFMRWGAALTVLTLGWFWWRMFRSDKSRGSPAPGVEVVR